MTFPGPELSPAASSGRSRRAGSPGGFRLVLLAFALATASAAAQTFPAVQPVSPLPANSVSVLESAVVPGSYIIGAGDLLSVVVFDHPELSGNVRVDSSGNIRVPYGKDPIPVAGMMADSVPKIVAAALVGDDLARDPQVQVVVRDVESRPIVVAGSVLKPLVFQALRPTPLLEALALAGGASPDAGTHLLVTTRHGGDVVTHDYPLAKVLNSADPADDPLLTGGEEVRVLPAGRVFVTGSVKEPGAFPLDNHSPMTVMKAVTLAHGWNPTANSSKCVLVRDNGIRREEIPLNLNRILKRKAPDVVMTANDLLYVPDSVKKSAGIQALKDVGEALAYGGGFLISKY
jgi:polysaccharide export outer membrane protein